jgi:hypothetical protein
MSELLTKARLFFFFFVHRRTPEEGTYSFMRNVRRRFSIVSSKSLIRRSISPHSAPQGVAVNLATLR